MMLVERGFRQLGPWLLIFFMALFLVGCETDKEENPEDYGTLRATPKGYYKVGKPYTVRGITYYPREDPNYDETGIASWYGSDFHGKFTANGEVYDQWSVTAAHKTLPMPTYVRVTNLENGRSLVVRINDRGPFVEGRIIDLSRRSAQLLGIEQQGTARVRVQFERSGRNELPSANFDDTGPYARQEEGTGQGDKLSRNVVASAVSQTKNPNKVVKAQALAPPPGAGVAPKVTPKSTNGTAVSNLPSAPVPQAVIRKTPPNLPQSAAEAPPEDLPTPKVETVPVKPTKLFVQVAALNQRDSAQRLRDRVARLGRAEITTYRFGNKEYYRVRLGPVERLEDADKLLSRVLSNGLIGAKIVVE